MLAEGSRANVTAQARTQLAPRIAIAVRSGEPSSSADRHQPTVNSDHCAVLPSRLGGSKTGCTTVTTKRAATASERNLLLALTVGNAARQLSAVSAAKTIWAAGSAVWTGGDGTARTKKKKAKVTNV